MGLLYILHKRKIPIFLFLEVKVDSFTKLSNPLLLLLSLRFFLGWFDVNIDVVLGVLRRWAWDEWGMKRLKLVLVEFDILFPSHNSASYTFSIVIWTNIGNPLFYVFFTQLSNNILLYIDICMLCCVSSLLRYSMHKIPHRLIDQLYINQTWVRNMG